MWNYDPAYFGDGIRRALLGFGVLVIRNGGSMDGTEILGILLTKAALLSRRIRYAHQCVYFYL